MAEGRGGLRRELKGKNESQSIWDRLSREPCANSQEGRYRGTVRSLREKWERKGSGGWEFKAHLELGPEKRPEKKRKKRKNK